jgi:RepB DNA-primase from phage plasmid
LRERDLLRQDPIKWLRAKNAHGYNIFFRPISYEFVLVDDLSIDALDAIRRDGIRSAVEIETSKANFQAWIRVADRNRPLDREAIIRVSRYLAHIYGGRHAVCET